MGGLMSLFKGDASSGGNGGGSKGRSGGKGGSGGQPSKITEQDRAQLKLKQQRDRVKQYRKKIIIMIDKEKQQAKTFMRDGHKSKALMILRKKKYQEKLLESTLNQIENLEHMISQLEFAEVEVKVLDGLKQGNKALEMLRKELSIEDVEEIMADAQELQQWANDIGEIVGTPIEEMDDDDLFAEFQTEVGEKVEQGASKQKARTAPAQQQRQQQQEEATAAAQGTEQLPDLPDLPEVPTEEPIVLPDVPSKEPEAAKEEEEEPEMVPA